MQSIKRSDLIIPERGGLALPRHITMRPRTPPKLKGHGKLKGRIRWELKRAGKVIAGGEQENLITNVGLDNFAECDDRWFTQFRSHGGVGTGSTTPAFTDTTIEGEVMTVSGSNDTRSDVVDTPNNQQISKATRKYVFNFTAAYNLNKFGFKAGASGSASVVQVFKGGAGTQITISVLANDQLTIYHELEIAFGPVGANVAASLDIVEKDRSGNIIATTTYTGWESFCTGGFPEDGVDSARASTYAPGHGVDRFWSVDAQRTGCNINDFIGGGLYDVSPSQSLQAYIAGSYKRVARVEIPETELNVTFYGFDLTFAPGASGSFSHQFVFDPNSINPTFTKDNAHTFSIDREITWARA